jgi:hypothetical protein
VSCKRVCRELLWLARFGELGVDSQPHLEHLTSCRSCRDEVGFDRAMVAQLRQALADRIADVAPSPEAWATILARASAPEPRSIGRVLAWSAALGGRLRITAIAATGLALLLALNTEIVPMTVPAADDAGGWEAFSVSTRQVPRQASARSPNADTEPLAASDAGTVTGVTAMFQPPSRTGGAAEPGVTIEEPVVNEIRIVFPAVDVFETAWFDESDVDTEDRPAEPPAPVNGEPS